LVKLCEPPSAFVRDKIRPHGGWVVAQRAADDLHDFTVAQVNAGTKHGQA